MGILMEELKGPFALSTLLYLTLLNFKGVGFIGMSDQKMLLVIC